MKLKIPPVMVAIFVFVVMRMIAGIPRFHRFRSPLQKVVAGLLALLGFWVAILGMLSFRRNRTTVHPSHPEKTTVLVVEGIYRYTRNPMYLGITLVLAAWGFFWGSAMALFMVPIFPLYITAFQIKPEEQALSEKFGNEFANYVVRFRRWF